MAALYDQGNGGSEVAENRRFLERVGLRIRMEHFAIRAELYGPPPGRKKHGWRGIGVKERATTIDPGL